MQSPFKFLDSYSKEDAAIFFGRDREIEELYQKVFESKILLVFGVSGTGKSSLIDCGLGNKIEDSDWLPISIRRGSGIIDSLWQKLNDLAISPSPPPQVTPSPVSPKQIVKKIKSVYLDNFKPIYLIFDQFEELFIFGSREEREEFIEIVRALMDADVQCKMLFSIREEYLANITEFERMVPEIMKNRMRVEKMSRINAMEVISGPCKVNGIELEDGFEEALMSKLVPEGNEVELTYLQVYLDKVFRIANSKGPKAKVGRAERRTEPVEVSRPTTQTNSRLPSGAEGQWANNLEFKIEILDQLGNVGDLLGSFLEDQIVYLDKPESGLAVLKSFVSVKGTKRQISHEEVLESCKTLGTAIEEETLKELINKFVDLRILRDKDENGRYELRHDSLAAKIYEKITLVEKEVMEVRLFIENAYSTFLARKTLLSDDDLKYVEPYEERLFLVKELQEFLDKSKSDFEAKKRSFKRTISISVVGFLLIIAAGAFYYYQQTQDRKMKDLTIYSMMQGDFSQEMGLITAMSAYEEDTANTISIKGLLDAFYTKLNAEPEVNMEIFDFKAVQHPILFIDLSTDGQNIFGYLENNEVKVWDLFGNEILTFNVPGKPIQLLRLSDNKEYLGMCLADSTVAVYSLLDSSFFTVNTTPNGVNDKYLFDFSNRDEYVLAVVESEMVKLYDKYGEVFQILSKHDSIVNAIDISPDRRFIATASSDARINVWYYNTKMQQYSLYNTIEKKSEGGVRSCQFNQFSDYILSASDDSSTTIRRLDGGQNVLLDWYDVAPGYPHYIIRKIEQSIFGQKCDAYFVNGEQMIVIRIRDDEEDADNFANKSNLYIVHNRSSAFFNSSGEIEGAYARYFVDELSHDRPIRYDFLVPAPDTRTVVTVRANEKLIKVVGFEHIPILVFSGTNPIYTQDSKYIISIKNNVLQKHLVDPGEIIDLVRNKEIFEELEYEVRDWLSY